MINIYCMQKNMFAKVKKMNHINPVDYIFMSFLRT